MSHKERSFDELYEIIFRGKTTTRNMLHELHDIAWDRGYYEGEITAHEYLQKALVDKVGNE